MKGNFHREELNHDLTKAGHRQLGIESRLIKDRKCHNGSRVLTMRFAILPLPPEYQHKERAEMKCIPPRLGCIGCKPHGHPCR